jgi:hypothetical protein
MKRSVNPKRRQRGMTTVSLIALIGVFAIFVVTILKVFPMYYGNVKLKSALEAIQQDSKIDPKSKRAIWTSLQKRLYIDDVDWVKRENVVMERKNGQTTITVTYETRDNLFGNMFIGMSFNESAVIDR